MTTARHDTDQPAHLCSQISVSTREDNKQSGNAHIQQQLNPFPKNKF